MILVLGDPVFSFQVGLCCVLGKFFLALSEPLGQLCTERLIDGGQLQGHQ